MQKTLLAAIRMISINNTQSKKDGISFLPAFNGFGQAQVLMCALVGYQGRPNGKKRLTLALSRYILISNAEEVKSPSPPAFFELLGRSLVLSLSSFGGYAGVDEPFICFSERHKRIVRSLRTAISR